MADPDVLRWQATLAALGFNPGPVDGVWGSRTAQAIRAFRAAAGLDPEGGIGPDFEAALFVATQDRGITVTVPAVPASPPGPGGGSPANPPMAPAGLPFGKILGVLLLAGAIGLWFFGRKR